MWKSYTKPVIWSSLVPCSTFYSTSQYTNSVLTSYTVVPETSYTWTTHTSYTTIFTTVVDTSYTTHTDEDTSWTTATTLTTEPILTTQLYSTTEVLYTTQPTTQYYQTTETLFTTEAIQTTDHYSTIETLFTTFPVATTQYFQTTETLLETEPILTIETVQTYLTSLKTHDITETFTATVSQTTADSSSFSSPTSSPTPPPVVITTSSRSTSSAIGSTSEAPAPVITPPPPPPVNPCDRPPYNDFFHVSWFGWRPVPGAEPLATIYRTVDPVSNVTTSSTFCNTPVYEKYYRTHLFDCARGCGPYQTLDNECNIVIGPVFTGPTCGGSGYKITQRGPSGNVMDLDTSIVGHGLTVSGRCIPLTSTTLQTPFIYSGDVQQAGNLQTALARRQDQAPLLLSDLTKSSEITPFNQPKRATAQFDEVQNNLPGAGTLFPPEVTKSVTQSDSDVDSAQAVTQSQSAPDAPVITSEPTETRSRAGTSSDTSSAGASSDTALPSSESGSGSQTTAAASPDLPSSSTVGSTTVEASSATVSVSVPVQTENGAPRQDGLSLHLGWLGAFLGLHILI